MIASVIFIVLTFAFATSEVTAQYTNQSAPFNLVLLSANSTINGSLLSACHEGAAIEGLCLGGGLSSDWYTQYTFNYSALAASDPVFGVTGALTWELRGVNFNLSSPMSLSVNPITNVAVPLFTPAETITTIGFDKDNKLFIPGYYDDTTVPGTYRSERYYRWYACTTNAGYVYQTLAWVIGNKRPENPTCQRVEVKRVFV